MSRRDWARLDNASNIFLAARRDDDPKVFRLAAELDEDIDPAVLQAALDATYDRYRLYHAVLRRGVFWYYLQDSGLRPLVEPEHLPSCAAIYQPDHARLLFRVVYRYRRISLEVFHALSDGTGGLWFLADLVDAYVRLRHPDDNDAGGVTEGEEDGARPMGGGPAPPGSVSAPGPQGPATGALHLANDGFVEHFRRGAGGGNPAAGTSGGNPASDIPVGKTSGATGKPPATVKPAGMTPSERVAGATRGIGRGIGQVHTTVRPRVYRVRGTHAPDYRTRAVELTMDAAGVLALARGLGVSPTIYLTGLFFESVRRAAAAPGAHPLGHHRTVAASVPVNLRQFFASESARNFFATVRVAHTYAKDGAAAAGDDLAGVCRELEEQFRAQIRPEQLEAKQRRLQRFARNPLMRIVPRMIKDTLLRLINWGNNRGLTVAVSNLGRMRFTGPAESHVGRMFFQVSAVRPQFCAVTHAGRMVITFTSPFAETGHVREFARLLTEQGQSVSVAATRVTEAELAGASETAGEAVAPSRGDRSARRGEGS